MNVTEGLSFFSLFLSRSVGSTCDIASRDIFRSVFRCIQEKYSAHLVHVCLESIIQSKINGDNNGREATEKI